MTGPTSAADVAADVVAGAECGAAGCPPSSTDADARHAPHGRPVSAVVWWVLTLSLAAVAAAGLQLWSKQTEYGFFVLACCFIVCIGAAALDVATRRIPNRLTYPAILIGLVINLGAAPLLTAFDASAAAVWLGATGPRDCVLGFGLCSVIGIISFIARGLGGGDVKLLAAVGAMIGLDSVIAVLFNTLLIAAIFGVTNWALRGTLMARAQIIASNVLTAMVTRQKTNVYPFAPTEAPFGLALLIGLTLAQFFAIHRTLLTVSW